jgi:putative tryptophan/tyrosine transport system substrate-binding protein
MVATHRLVPAGMLAVLLSAGSPGWHAAAAGRAGPALIGALTESWGPTPHIAGLRDGLLELGYRENEQFVIGVRFTQGDLTTLPAAARELVQQGVDILFTSEPAAAKAAQAATARIPIVFTGGGDPLGLGIIRSFARPGGNTTGVTDLDLELAPKRLEIFRQILPGLRRVLFPYDPNDPYTASELRVHRDAARRLGLVLVEKPVRTQDEAQAVLAGVRKGEVDGIISPRFLSLNIPGFILEANLKLVIPAMFHTTFWAELGGLASYGPDFHESGRQAARLVDKILKGADPGTIPVEVNPKLEFAINLKTARTLGLTIAPEVLYQANRVFR